MFIKKTYIYVYIAIQATNITCFPNLFSKQNLKNILSTKSGMIGTGILAALIGFGGHKIIEKIYYNYKKKIFIEEFIKWFNTKKNAIDKKKPVYPYYKLIFEETLMNYLQKIPSKKLIMHVQKLRKNDTRIINLLPKNNNNSNQNTKNNAEAKDNLKKSNEIIDFTDNFSLNQILLYKLIVNNGEFLNNIETYNIKNYKSLKDYFEQQQQQQAATTIQKIFRRHKTRKQQQQQRTTNKFNLFVENKKSKKNFAGNKYKESLY